MIIKNQKEHSKNQMYEKESIAECKNSVQLLQRVFPLFFCCIAVSEWSTTSGQQIFPTSLCRKRGWNKRFCGCNHILTTPILYFLPRIYFLLSLLATKSQRKKPKIATIPNEPLDTFYHYSRVKSEPQYKALNKIFLQRRYTK